MSDQEISFSAIVNDRYEEDYRISLLAEHQYMREVSWIQTLDPLQGEEEGKLLGYLARAKREPENAWVARLAEHARERLVEGYQPLVIHHARRASRGFHSMELLDLINEGNIGLLQAIDTCVEKPIPFLVCASVCVRQSLWAARYGGGSLWSHVPSDVRQLLSRLRRLRSQWNQIHSEALSVADFAVRLEVSEAHVEEALSVESFQDMGSIQALIRENDAEDRHRFVSPFADGVEDGGERQQALFAVFQWVLERELTPRQREIMELRYGFGEGVGECRSLRQVAAMLGVTNQSVLKCERVAKRKLRKALETVTVGCQVSCELRSGYRGEYYTVKEAAAVLGVCTQTVRKHIHQGRLPVEVREGRYDKWVTPKQAVHSLASSGWFSSAAGGDFQELSA